MITLPVDIVGCKEELPVKMKREGRWTSCRTYGGRESGVSVSQEQTGVVAELGLKTARRRGLRACSAIYLDTHLCAQLLNRNPGTARCGRDIKLFLFDAHESLGVILAALAEPSFWSDQPSHALSPSHEHLAVPSLDI